MAFSHRPMDSRATPKCQRPIHFPPMVWENHWVAYSWLFEVLVYGLFTKFGLMGILVFTVAMSLLIALALHSALRRAGLPFIVEVFLVAVGLGAMIKMISPRSWLFSILFFTVELSILFHVRRTNKIASLLALPPLFALWANLHMQFIYGLAVLGLFLVEVLLSQLPSFTLAARRPDISLGRISLLLLTCLIATLITPYHFRLYIPIFEVHWTDRSFSVDLGAPSYYSFEISRTGWRWGSRS